MANVKKVSVALTPEMAAMMREALCDWKHRRTQRAKAVEELGRLWDAGMNSGPAIDGEAAFARVRQKLDAKIAERGAE